MTAWAPAEALPLDTVAPLPDPLVERVGRYVAMARNPRADTRLALRMGQMRARHNGITRTA